MNKKEPGSWADSKGLAWAILHERQERRKWLGRLTLVPIAMMITGLWALNDWIWASPWRVLCWWGGCAVATVVVILFALYDALAVLREERKKDRFDVDPS